MKGQGGGKNWAINHTIHYWLGKYKKSLSLSLAALAVIGWGSLSHWLSYRLFGETGIVLILKTKWIFYLRKTTKLTLPL